MEEGRARFDLSATAWCRGGERKRRRLLAAAALGLCVRGGREARKSRMYPLALEARQIMFALLTCFNNVYIYIPSKRPYFKK